jgi:hypothetical protein
MKLFYSTCVLLLTSVSLAQQSSSSKSEQSVQSMQPGNSTSTKLPGQSVSSTASGSNLIKSSGQSTATSKKNGAGSNYSTYLPVLISAQMVTYVVYTFI